MKLVLKQTDLGVWLHTEDGTPLPQQMSVRVDSEPGAIPTITVVFCIGDDVVLAAHDREPEGDSIDQTIFNSRRQWL